MASLRKKPRSPYWFACFTDAHGARTQRSTKQSDRRKAQAVADKWAKASKLGSEKRLGEAQARRVLSEIYEIVNNEPLALSSTRSFFVSWAQRRKADASPATQKAYAQVTRDFLASLGDKSERDISQVGKADLTRYRDIVVKRTSISTANKSLKILRVAFGAAYRDGLAQDNPAAKIETLRRPRGQVGTRRPFTLPELKTTLALASADWKGIILFGLYTGARLKDIARLTWQNVDTELGELRYVTGKTMRRMHLPLAKPLVAHLGTLSAGDDPASPLFPHAHSIATGAKDDSRLSQQFYEILFAAGLVSGERKKDKTGKGRSQRRTVNELSFHSLRHTANSLLKNAGVPDAVVMDLVGHDSADSSNRYTHIDQDSKRKALANLPDVTI